MIDRTRIVQTRHEAARLLGVSVRTLADWKTMIGFPDCSFGYVIDAIRDWRAATLASRDTEAGAEVKAIKRKISAEKLRQEHVKAERLERQNAVELGEIVDRHDWEMACIELVTVCRDSLLHLPRSLCSVLPKKYHRKLIAEGTAIVEKALAALVAGLESVSQQDDD